MKKILIAIISLILLLAGGVFVYSVMQSNEQKQIPASGEPTGDYIDMEPATETEESDSESRKNPEEKTDDTDNTAADGNATKAKVNPIITTWNQNKSNGTLDINGFVEKIVESDGTCTIALSKNGKKVSESKKATANVSNTTCGVIEVPLNKLSAGTWQAVLTYSSPDSFGTSSDVNIEVE